MKKSIIIFTILLVCLPAVCQATFPTRLCSFTLGDDISKYQDKLEDKTLTVSGYYDYIAEMDIVPMEGLNGGSVLVSRCDTPDKILSIKLKFEDTSKSFFKKLMQHYEKEFGKPDEYKGDVFQSVIAWKWSFENDKGDRISLIIQHNKMVQEEKIGNTVKLSLVSQIEKEKACFLDRQQENPKSDPIRVTPGKQFWDLYTPK